MQNYFNIADKSKDQSVSYDEISRFLQKINLKMTKEQIQAYFSVVYNEFFFPVIIF